MPIFRDHINIEMNRSTDNIQTMLARRLREVVPNFEPGA